MDEMSVYAEREEQTANWAFLKFTALVLVILLSSAVIGFACGFGFGKAFARDHCWSLSGSAFIPVRDPECK